jgi:DNA-binding MarR family transcriptional regulator
VAVERWQSFKQKGMHIFESFALRSRAEQTGTASVSDAHFHPVDRRHEELVRHPLMPAAVAAAASSAIALYQGNRLLNALATDRVRFLLSIFCVYLDEQRNMDGSGEGLTVGRAKVLAAQLRLCSPGRVTAILALMRWGGYLAPAPKGADRRHNLLVPTERLIDGHRQRWQGQLGAAALVLPTLRQYLPKLQTYGGTAAFAVAQTRGFLSGTRMLDTVEEMALFTDRDCGLLILFWIYVAGGPEQPVHGRPIALSVSDIAARFSVSRAHVHRLLLEAEMQGMLRNRRGRRTEVELLPKLEELLHALMARIFRFNAHAAAQATAMLEEAESAATLSRAG